MIDAQLGPPVAVASRGGSAPTGGAGGDNATANRTPADDGGFTAALEDRRTPPASSDARPAEAHTDTDAAGPRTGELQEEAAADVGASQQETAAAGIAAAIAAAVTAVVPTVASATPPAGAGAGQQIAQAVQAAGPPQPIAGLVPARLDGNGGVMPATAAPAAGTQVAPGQLVAAQVLAAVPASSVAVAQVAAAAGAPATTTTAPQAPAVPAPAAPAAQASAAAPANAAAATLTLTISTPAVVDAGAADPAASSQLLAAQATTPVAEALKGQPALRPQVSEAASSVVVATPEPPAGSVGPAPVAQPVQTDPLGGIVRSGGGLTTPHELARELGSRVHMAVREGGRELVVQLRPADLGHLTIRVTMTDGIMQATIIADRPEAARMLQQSLGNLDAALGDLGYSLDNLDVAYQGQDPRDAQASSRQAEEAVAGEVLEADGSPAVSGTPTSSSAGGTAGLDLLA